MCALCWYTAGGPAINQMLNRVGKESKFVNGLRYTDKETMSIVQQVLAGQVNKDLVALLKGRGVGLCGLDGHTITCSRKSDVDLGYVGNVEKVDTTLIEHLLNDGFIPVIATVGMDENGIAYKHQRRNCCSRHCYCPARRKVRFHDGYCRPAV